MKKRNKNILIGICIIVLSYVVIVEINNYFDDGFHETSVWDNQNECWVKLNNGEIVRCAESLKPCTDDKMINPTLDLDPCIRQ